MTHSTQQKQIHQLYDKFLKDMAEHHSEELLGVAFPEEQFKILSAQLDKELILRSRQVDTVMLVRTRRGRQIFHLEFKTEYNRKELRKIFGYAGALTLKYRLDVTTILYLVRPPSKRAGDLGLYQAMPFGVPTNQFGFRVVRLWELLDAILAGDKRLASLIPLLLELVEKPDITYLHRQRKLIRLQNDPVRRAELYYYTAAFAKRHFSQNFLRSFFKEDKEMYEHWEHVPIVDEIIQEQKQKSRKEGQREILQEIITEELEAHFGQVNGKITRMVNSIDDPRKLKAIFQRVKKAKSLDTVVNTLQKAKPTAKRNTVKA